MYCTIHFTNTTQDENIHPRSSSTSPAPLCYANCAETIYPLEYDGASHSIRWNLEVDSHTPISHDATSRPALALVRQLGFIFTRHVPDTRVIENKHSTEIRA